MLLDLTIGEGAVYAASDVVWRYNMKGGGRYALTEYEWMQKINSRVVHQGDIYLTVHGQRQKQG